MITNAPLCAQVSTTAQFSCLVHKYIWTASGPDLGLNHMRCTQAKQCGFSAEDGTLGEVFDIIPKSDLVILLISDAAQVHLLRQHVKRGLCQRLDDVGLLFELQTCERESTCL